MNEYSRGVCDALFWIDREMEMGLATNASLKKMRGKIQDTIQRLQMSIAQDLQSRIDFLPE